MAEDCVFCKIADKKVPAEIVFENDFLVAFKDLNPKAPVHILIIPKRHIATLNDLQPGDAGYIEDIFLRIKELAASAGISKNGYRVVTNCNRDGGQEVFHLHFHLLGGRGLNWPPG